MSRVQTPSLEEGDRKRLPAERQRPVQERTSPRKSITESLNLHGVFCRKPRAKDFEANEPVEENLFAGMCGECYLMGVRSWLAK